MGKTGKEEGETHSVNEIRDAAQDSASAHRGGGEHGEVEVRAHERETFLGGNGHASAQHRR